MTIRWFSYHTLPSLIRRAKEKIYAWIYLGMDQYKYVQSCITYKTPVEQLITNWNRYLYYNLRLFGWNKLAIKNFTEWGMNGHNNKLLWFDKQESTIDDFISDVHYCSDRQSLDRLFRCNWMLHKIVYENNKNT